MYHDSNSSGHANTNACPGCCLFPPRFPLVRVFAIAKTRNNDANEKSSAPGFDDLVGQSGKENESNFKESKLDTESEASDFLPPSMS